MPSLSLSTGQISAPVEVGPGARVTTVGSGYVEWTTGTLADVRNGVAVWQRWPGGSAGDNCDTLRRVVIRGVATGALSVTWDEGKNDPGPDGVYWQESASAGLRVEDFGAVLDGVTDDTAAVLSAINAASAQNGGVVVIPVGKVAAVRADALTWNAHNVVIRSDGIGHSLGSTAKPATLKFTSGGSYGIKIGAAANYPSGLKYGNAIIGVKLDFNGQGFTDAALVIEGQTRFKLEDSMVYSPGASTKAMRLKCVWDSTFLNNYFHSLTNPGAALFDLDSYQTDTSGNNNNLRWSYNHFENLDGAVFYCRSSANMDICQWLFNKFEMGTAATGSTTANFVFDLRSCSHVQIDSNTFNAFTTAKFAGLIRLDDSGTNVYHTSVQNNAINAFSAGAWIHFGQGARNSIVDRNRHYNAASTNYIANSSLYQNYYVKPSSTAGGEYVDVGSFEKHFGGGWIAASVLRGSSSGKMIPDIASVAMDGRNNATPYGYGSVWRITTTAQGTEICSFPMGKFRDFPVAVTCYVRCRRTQGTGTAALQVAMNNGTVAQNAAFDALPSAVTSISFDGDGTTVTATKVAHGFKIGDRIIVTGTTNYNTTANQPVQILTVADANTFTFASSVNQNAESGSAQLCPWQIISFTLPTGTFSGVTPPDTNGTFGGMGRESGETFRLEYGASNDQPIDVDAVAFKY